MNKKMDTDTAMRSPLLRVEGDPPKDIFLYMSIKRGKWDSMKHDLNNIRKLNVL